LLAARNCTCAFYSEAKNKCALVWRFLQLIPVGCLPGGRGQDRLIDLWGSRSYKIAYTAVGGRPEIVCI